MQICLRVKESNVSSSAVLSETLACLRGLSAILTEKAWRVTVFYLSNDARGVLSNPSLPTSRGNPPTSTYFSQKFRHEELNLHLM